MTTLEEVLIQTRANNRICPLPQKRQQLYEMLPNKRRHGNGWVPSLPLILAAWHETNAPSKMQRLCEHIAWADAHNFLEEIHFFLTSLSEDQWHHIGE
jgi:hypothetical protein